MWTPPADLSPAAIVRRMIRAADRAMLATHGRTMDGFPYASLVELACDPRGRPILLLSTLAEHTKALDADGRASLLIDATGGYAEPLTGPRASLVGTLERIPADAARPRYLARHPAAGLFAGFGDFGFFRMEIARAHLVAGFGRIHWVEGASILGEEAPDALTEAEAEIIAHMNADHSDAVGLIANRILGLPGVGWRLTGVDRDGCDLRRGGDVARVDFVKPVADAEGARVELVRLTKQARRDSPSPPSGGRGSG